MAYNLHIVFNRKLYIFQRLFYDEYVYMFLGKQNQLRTPEIKSRHDRNLVADSLRMSSPHTGRLASFSLPQASIQINEVICLKSLGNSSNLPHSVPHLATNKSFRLCKMITNCFTVPGTIFHRRPTITCIAVLSPRSSSHMKVFPVSQLRNFTKASAQ